MPRTDKADTTKAKATKVNPIADLLPAEARTLIGRTARVTFGALTFLVTIKDYKFAYGNHRWFVTPTAGSGEAWTENLTLL